MQSRVFEYGIHDTVPFTSFWYILSDVLDRSLIGQCALVVDHSSTVLATFKSMSPCEFLFQTEGQIVMFCFPLKWQEAELEVSLRIVLTVMGQVRHHVYKRHKDMNKRCGIMVLGLLFLPLIG